MKVRAFFVILLYLCTFSSVFAQNNLLQTANDYFDNGNYEEARKIYLESIRENKWDGELLYKFTYSNEMVYGINNEILKYYAATYFWIEDPVAKEYIKNILTENDPSLLEINFGQMKKIINSMKKPNFEMVSPLKKLSSLLTQQEHWFLLVIITIIIYTLALLLSHKTSCIIIWGWWDLLITVIPGIIFVYYLFNMDNVVKYDTILNVIFFIITVTSFSLSIIINIKYSGVKSIFYATISIITKLIIMILVPLIIFLFFMALTTGKSDRRYKDGTKGNTKTLALAIVGFVAFFLVINIIKLNDEDKLFG